MQVWPGLQTPPWGPQSSMLVPLVEPPDDELEEPVLPEPDVLELSGPLLPLLLPVVLASDPEEVDRVEVEVEVELGFTLPDEPAELPGPLDVVTPPELLAVVPEPEEVVVMLVLAAPLPEHPASPSAAASARDATVASCMRVGLLKGHLPNSAKPINIPLDEDTARGRVRL